LKLHNLLIKSVDSALELFFDNGHFPAVHRKSRRHYETPMRTTSHWLISLSKAYKITGKEKYKNALIKSVNFLLKTEARPNGYSFSHRQNTHKSNCGGLICQAYALEALAEAYSTLANREIIKEAVQVFLLHPFEKSLGLWKKVETDGTILGFDNTFNHQLWFAAVGGLIGKFSNENEINRRVEVF